MTVDQIIEAIGQLTVGEMRDLTLRLQEKYDVTSAQSLPAPEPLPYFAPVQEEEQFEFEVTLVAVNPEQKVNTIKVIRELSLVGVDKLGLKEAKHVVDNAPYVIGNGVTREVAEKAKAALEAVGATVEVK